MSKLNREASIDEINVGDIFVVTDKRMIKYLLQKTQMVDLLKEGTDKLFDEITSLTRREFFKRAKVTIDYKYKVKTELWNKVYSLFPSNDFKERVGINYQPENGIITIISIDEPKINETKL